MTDRKYSNGLWTWGNLGDRFTMAGYRPGWGSVESIEMAATVPNLSGLEFTYPDNLNEDNWKEVKAALERTGLEYASCYNNISSDPKWQRGAMTADPAIRAQAIAHAKACMDLAAEMGGDRITFSLLQDGWDYPFQASYTEGRELIVSALQEIADHRSDITVGIEYKPREPRVHCYIADTPTTILLLQRVNRPNTGVVIDVGHTLNAGETMGDAIALLAEHDMLLHTHLNDNWRDWDDDMIVGSIHFLETMELMYWMRRVGYEGWYGLDIFPYREDPTEATAESIRFMETYHTVIDRIGMDKLGELIQQGEPTETLKVIRQAAFNTDF
jgi:sugar phosphate isomerase/epimerase